MNNHTKRWERCRIDENKLVSDEKKKLIVGLFKDDPKRYHKARLGRIFSVEREYVGQLIKAVDKSLDK